MNNKYYAVDCKGGHVGRNRYMPITLYFIADNGKEAAAMAKETGRVKHDHKDCILGVYEIDYDEYLAGRKRNSEDPYFMAKNIQEQRSCEGIYERTLPEREANPWEKNRNGKNAYRRKRAA